MILVLINANITKHQFEQRMNKKPYLISPKQYLIFLRTRMSLLTEAHFLFKLLIIN